MYSVALVALIIMASDTSRTVVNGNSTSEYLQLLPEIMETSTPEAPSTQMEEDEGVSEGDDINKTLS